MPWVRALRVLPGLWIAWVENDLHEMNEQRLGFTEAHAKRRIAARWDGQ